MHKIEIGKKIFSLPAKLEDLSVSQVLIFFQIYANPQMDTMTKRALLIQAFLDKKALELIAKLNENQIFSLFQLFDWIEADLPCKVMLPEFEHKGIMYLAPKDKFSTSCIAEYIYASNCLVAIAKGKENYLKNLCAGLYRPKDIENKSKSKTADLREKFDTDNINDRVEDFKTLAYNKQIAILFFFVSVQRHFQEKYPEVFEEGESSVSADWSQVLLRVAESTVFGNIDSVKYANCHEVMKYLKMKKIDAENATKTK